MQPKRVESLSKWLEMDSSYQQGVSTDSFKQTTYLPTARMSHVVLYNIVVEDSETPYLRVDILGQELGKWL